MCLGPTAKRDGVWLFRGADKSKQNKSKINNNIKTNTTPTIIIEGENPFFLSLGESFEEPGVRAEDKEDGELVVTSSENIDKHKEGKYAVIYMATDRQGNSAIDKRYVVVGEEGEEDDANEERSEEPTNEPTKPSFIKEGQHVKQGNVLMLIEAMKTFNEIKAPKSGVIKQIIALNSRPVEFGEALIIFE